MTTPYSVAAQQVVASAPIFYGIISAGSPVALQARIQDPSGNAANLSSGISSVTATVTDMMADTAGAPVSLNVSSTVLNTPVTPPIWTIDSTGYNLSVQLDGSNFPTPDTTYQVVVSIQPAAGGSPFQIIWQLQTDVQL